MICARATAKVAPIRMQVRHRTTNSEESEVLTVADRTLGSPKKGMRNSEASNLL